MEERKEPERDLEKELSEAPFKRQGFSERLRRQIESELNGQSGSSPAAKRTAAAAAFGIVLAVSAICLISGSRSVPAAEPQAMAGAAGEPTQAAASVDDGQTAAPIRSALLIGLRQDHEHKDDKHASNVTRTSTYRTLLIAPNRYGKMVVAAEGPGILMPYRQWFWKIDTADWETPSDSYHYLVARQADQPLKPESFLDDPDEELKHSEKLLYAGNQYVSIAETENAWAGNYPVEYNRISVKRITQIGMNRVTNFATNKTDPNRVTLQDIYGSEAGDMLAEMQRNRNTASPLSTLNGDSWTIKRKPGRWIAAAAETFATPNNRFEGYELRDFPLPLPEPATSYDTLSLKWGEIITAQPKAKDALTSPLDDMVAIFSGNWLYIYAYRKPLDGSPLLAVQLQPDETMVMAQWATGGYVEEWVHKARLYLTPLSAEGSR